MTKKRVFEHTDRGEFIAPEPCEPQPVSPHCTGQKVEPPKPRPAPPPDYNPPPKCVYKVPAPPPEREWLGRDARDDWSFGSPGVPDGMVCAGMFIRCADNCGPDCEDYRAVQPQQPRACTCSQQQGQSRPFVQAHNLIILLDDFSSFRAYSKNQSESAFIDGLDFIGNWKALISTETWQEAEDIFDAIQAAIEHWNRAVKEPEHRCSGTSWDKELREGRADAP